VARDATPASRRLGLKGMSSNAIYWPNASAPATCLYDTSGVFAASGDGDLFRDSQQRRCVSERRARVFVRTQLKLRLVRCRELGLEPWLQTIHLLLDHSSSPSTVQGKRAAYLVDCGNRRRTSLGVSHMCICGKTEEQSEKAQSSA
jgi:hypothetical protein